MVEVKRGKQEIKSECLKMLLVLFGVMMTALIHLVELSILLIWLNSIFLYYTLRDHPSYMIKS